MTISSRHKAYFFRKNTAMSDKTTCIICYEPITKDEIKCSKCGSCMHSDCWSMVEDKSKCPYCTNRIRFDIRYQVVHSIDEITGMNVEIHDVVFNNPRRLFYEHDDIINLKFVNCKVIGDCTDMFAKMSNLETLDLEGLDVSEATIMESMFDRCVKLYHINFGTFDTSNVTDMRYMFGYTKLPVLKLNFNTSNVTDMTGMFEACKAEKLELQFDTSRVTNMAGMFHCCFNIEHLDLSSFDTSNVTNMEYMFNECRNLESLTHHLNTVNVENMKSMFNTCISLMTLDTSSFITSKVTNMSEMFCGCPMIELELEFDTSNVENMYYMFSSMNNLEKLDISTFNTSNVRTMEGMFDGCVKLQNLDLSHFDTSNVASMDSMFLRCKSLTTLDLSHFDTREVRRFDFMFSGCENIETLDLSNFNTSHAYVMQMMFSNMYKLKHLNISSFDTSNVESMNSMFLNCKSLKELDIRHFNLSKVKNMDEMFKNCYGLPKLEMQEIPEECECFGTFVNTFKAAILRSMFGEFDKIVECIEFHNARNIEFITLSFDIKADEKSYPDISWEWITYTNILAYKLKATNSGFEWRDKDGIYYGWTTVLYKDGGFDVNAIAIIKEIWNERDMRMDMFKISQIEVNDACEFYSTDGEAVSLEHMKNNKDELYIVKLKDIEYRTIAENDLFAHKIVEGEAVNYDQIDDFINTWYYENPATE